MIVVNKFVDVGRIIGVKKDLFPGCTVRLTGRLGDAGSLVILNNKRFTGLVHGCSSRVGFSRRAGR